MIIEKTGWTPEVVTRQPIQLLETLILSWNKIAKKQAGEKEPKKATEQDAQVIKRIFNSSFKEK